MDKAFYNELLTGHNLYPDYKYDLEDYNLELEGVNPTCGDEITLRLLVEDRPFFSLKLRYHGDDLVEAVLDGELLPL